MSYRQNTTDKGQNELEQATFEGGIAVEVDATQRVIPKGADTAAERTSHAAGVNFGKNAGVVMPHDDNPGVFLTPGKA